MLFANKLYFEDDIANKTNYHEKCGYLYPRSTVLDVLSRYIAKYQFKKTFTTRLTKNKSTNSIYNSYMDNLV